MATHPSKAATSQELQDEIKRLECLLQEKTDRLQEAQETLDAIRSGAVDGLVRSTTQGDQVFLLKGSDEPYRNLIEQMTEGALLVSETGTILFCNHGFARLVDAPLEGVMGSNIQEWVNPNSTFGIEVFSDNTKTDQRRFDVTFKTTKQQPVPTQISINRISLDSINASALIVTDLTKHMEEDVKRYTGGLEREITERKKAEEALRASEERLNVIIQSPSFIAFVRSLKTGKVLFVNEGFEKTLGYSKEEITGVIPPNIWANPKDRDELFRELRTQRFVRFYEAPVKRKDNSTFWAAGSAGLVNFDGEESILAIITDVTERKKAEEALRISEERFRIALKNSPITLIELDNELRFKWIYNPTIGQKPEQIIGKKVGETGTVEDITPLVNFYSSVLKNNEPKRSEVKLNRFSDVAYYDIYAEPLRDEKGEIKGLVTASTDITERKKAEEALKENEQLYHTVFDNSQDGFQLLELIYNETGKPIDFKFLKVNRSYETIIGAKANDIIGKTARYVSPNIEQYWLDVPDRVAKTGNSEHIELYNKDIDKWLDCFYFCYSKDVVGTLFRDITARKKMEKQLQDAERMAAIGQVAGMVGHDIRNPLQAIVGELYFAKETMNELPQGGPKEALESLEFIQQQADYISKIVSDLQDYAKPLKPDFTSVELCVFISEAVKAIVIPENIQTAFYCDKQIPQIKLDKTFTTRVLTNLVNNAIQAMPQGGKLTINASLKNNAVEITVEDTGVGISEDIKPKMFTPLFTTKSKGQGFGLPVVKRLVEAQGGSIRFESEAGKGTEFIITLPLTR